MLYDSPVRYGDQRCSNDAGLFDVTGLSLEFWRAVGVPDKADWAGSGAGIFVYFSVPRVIHRTPHGLMDSMDLVIKINKLKNRINGVHGLSMDSMDCLWTPWTLKDLYQLLKRIHGVHGPSMDSMDYRRIVQTLEKGNGVHGLSMDSMDSRRLV